MSGWILMFTLAAFVAGFGILRFGKVIIPREACLTLGQQPRKEYQCTPGKAGADVTGPQGSPGRDCYPVQDANGSFVCSYSPPNLEAIRYTQQQNTMAYEWGVYVFWALVVGYTVYTVKRAPGFGGFVLALSVALTFVIQSQLPR
jgi:hypothetical protein